MGGMLLRDESTPEVRLCNHQIRLLACVFVRPAILAELKTVITSQYFLSETYRAMFAAAVTAWNRGDPVTPQVVADNVIGSLSADKTGDVIGLCFGVADALPHAGDWRHWANAVADDAIHARTVNLLRQTGTREYQKRARIYSDASRRRALVEEKIYGKGKKAEAAR